MSDNKPNMAPNKKLDILGWIDDRFPLTQVWNEHVAQYYAPKNFNFYYFACFFG